MSVQMQGYTQLAICLLKKQDAVQNLIIFADSVSFPPPIVLGGKVSLLLDCLNAHLTSLNIISFSMYCPLTSSNIW